MPNRPIRLSVISTSCFLFVLLLLPSPLARSSNVKRHAALSTLSAPFAFPVTERKGVRQSDGSIIFHCSTATWSRLRLPETNEAIAASRVSYHFENIQWRAGDGWPTYSSRCPRNDKNSNDVYPNSPRHMLIVQFGGTYFDECANSNTGAGNEITEIFVGANDDQLGDNKGGFDIVITDFSKN